MKDFRDLKVWRAAHDLVLAVYAATRSFPREEIYGLTSQMRRAAASIPGNIAEGCGCTGDRAFGRYLQIAMGSASELEYYLLLAFDLRYTGPDVHQDLTIRATDVKRMLASLLVRVRAEPVPPVRLNADC